MAALLWQTLLCMRSQGQAQVCDACLDLPCISLSDAPCDAGRNKCQLYPLRADSTAVYAAGFCRGGTRTSERCPNPPNSFEVRR